MANGGKNTSGTLLRELQLGLDSTIEHFDAAYIGPYMELFDRVACPKGFYEIEQVAGMGPAAMRNEGGTLTAFDTINQDFNPRYTIYSYEKGARATYEAIADNMYRDLVGDMAKCIVTSHNVNKDLQAAVLLNSCTTTTWGDGVAMLSTAHPIQAGGTNSNRLSPDLDLSMDALQQADILIRQFVLPSGLLGDYEGENLVIPLQLRFIANVILGSKYNPQGASNAINPVVNMGIVKGVVEWRRLTSATTWFMSTNRKEKGLILAEKMGIETKTFQDDYTRDTICNAWTRFRFLLGDHRCIAGSVGP